MANPPVPRHDTLPEDASVAKWITDSERFLKAIDGDITTVTRIIVTGVTPISLTIINNIRKDLELGGRAPINIGGLSGLPINVDTLIGDARGFSTTIIFSALDNNTIQWTAGTITFGGGSVFTIVAGNTGNMTATTYIYFDSGVSTTALQISTNPDDASGVNKQYLSSASPVADTNQNAFFAPVVGVFGINETVIGPNSISTPLLQADAVTANEILANTITGTEINGTVLSGIFADLGTIVAGSMTAVIITGGTFRTAATGERIEIIAATPDSITWFGVDNLNNAILKYDEALERYSIFSQGPLRITTNGTTDFQFDSTNGLTMFGLNLTSVGNIACDSITKDGAGNIAINSIIDMGGRNIINVGQLELDSLIKDGAGNIAVNSILDMTENNIVNVGAIFLDSIRADATTIQCFSNFEPFGTPNLGGTAARWNCFFATINVSSTTTFGSLGYIWPSTRSAGQQLQTDGGTGLTWAAAGSLRKIKKYLKRRKDSFEALERLCLVPVYDFKYKKGKGTQTEDWYIGVMAEDLPEVMHHEGKIFSPVSGFGYLLLGMQELNKRIAKLGG